MDARRKDLLDALEALRPALRAFARARVSEAALAEDVLQDVAIRILSAELPEKIENKSAYLFSVTSNLLRDLRRRAVRQNTENHLPIYDLELADPAPSPEHALGDRMDLEQAHRAIRALPEEMRRVFMLYRFENLTLEETAARANLTVPRVRKLLAKAIALIARRVRRETT